MGAEKFPKLQQSKDFIETTFLIRLVFTGKTNNFGCMVKLFRYTLGSKNNIFITGKRSRLMQLAAKKAERSSLS